MKRRWEFRWQRRMSCFWEMGLFAICVEEMYLLLLFLLAHFFIYYFLGLLCSLRLLGHLQTLHQELRRTRRWWLTMEQFRSLLSYWVLLVMMLGSRYILEWMYFSKFLKHRLCIVWGFIWAPVEPVYFVFNFFFLGMFFVLFMFKICMNEKRDKYHFLILSLLHFYSIFCFRRKEIKFEQKYLFTLDFNRNVLRKTNETYHRLVKWYFSNHG